ncbi:MAG: Mth938-like domain-containing protein [Rhizobiaceae bacterium]|nr:Mth938-like domain-containing protein [Rhizobiaceae bacterium]
MSDDAKGIQFREAHFPGRAPIDAYGDGGFRFAQMSHRGSILCLPSGIYGWNVSDNSEFTVGNFRKLLEEASEIEVLLVGMGEELIAINPLLRKALREASISADPMSTGAAVRTFNVLLAEGRAVSAALLAVQ